MNSVICNRVKALCESLGGIWTQDDMGWLECKIEGLRVLIGPNTGLVEVNSTYGSGRPYIYHDGQTDEVLIKITEIHKIASAQAAIFNKLVDDVEAHLIAQKIPVEVRRADSDFAKFMLGDRFLFHIDAEHLLDGGPFVLQAGITEYGVYKFDEVIGCLNKTTQQDVEAPWMHADKYGNVYYIGDIAYFIPAMLRHGVENTNRHIGIHWAHSPDPILQVLLGNETPMKKDYFSIRFTDGVIPTEVVAACNS